VFLKFAGANYRTLVFLNKQYLGMHQGGSTPFFVEITDVIESENRLLVVVNNTRRPSNVPMDNTDWFNYGGIYREVELLRVPKTFIREFAVGLTGLLRFARNDETVTSLRAKRSNPENDKPPYIFARVRIDGAEAEGNATLRIPELAIEASIAIKDGVGCIATPAAPELWSPANPKLYEVILEYGADSLTEKIGFRSIHVEGREIFLNGEKIFLKGVCAHEESVEHGKSVTSAEIRENYALAKEMGCNFLRLAHYPHAEAAARIADEVGLLLWEEIPVYWAIDFANPATYADAENQLVELITRDINRASVIIWSVGNENSDSEERFSFMSRLVEKARSLDATRLVSAACLADHEKLLINDRLAEKIDVIGINEYYGWYDPDFSKLPKLFANSDPQKPVIISEFGADTKAGFHADKSVMYSEEFQLDVYEKQIATLSKIDYIKGITPWILFDFRCPRRLNVVQDYYNLKGLLSADKKQKKLAFGAMKEFYHNFKL
jgi:beta-glucuronidase